MRASLKGFFSPAKFCSMRNCIIVLGTLICVLAGVVFLVQAILENRSLHGQFDSFAWQMTSVQLAELNTGRQPADSHEQYSLVTEDCGTVDLDLELLPSASAESTLNAELDPLALLERRASDNSLSYCGTFKREDQEYHQTMYLIFRSDHDGPYHLTPRGNMVGYFSLTQPISRAKRALLMSHITKFAFWIGLCAAIWFILIGIGGKLLKQLEAANSKLIDAERNMLINKVVCTYNHRINSPLMGIYGSIELLSETEEDPRKIKLIRSLGEAADKIKESTDKIAALENYRFVGYAGQAEMIELAEKKGKAGVACHNSRSVGYRVG